MYNHLFADGLVSGGLHYHQPGFPSLVGHGMICRGIAHKVSRFGRTEFFSLGHRFSLVTEHAKGKAAIGPKLKFMEKARKADHKYTVVHKRLATSADAAFHRLAIAPYLESQWFSGFGHVDRLAKMPEICCRLLIQLEDEVAFSQAGEGGGGIGV